LKKQTNELLIGPKTQEDVTNMII